jgi:hypothetical protein
LALGIEKQIKARLTSDRPSAEHYEQALQDYFRDLSIPASVEEEE